MAGWSNASKSSSAKTAPCYNAAESAADHAHRQTNKGNTLELAISRGITLASVQQIDGLQEWCRKLNMNRLSLVNNGSSKKGCGGGGRTHRVSKVTLQFHKIYMRQCFAQPRYNVHLALKKNCRVRWYVIIKSQWCESDEGVPVEDKPISQGVKSFENDWISVCSEVIGNV